MQSDFKYRFIDSHVHIRGTESAGVRQTIEGIYAIKEQTNMDAINVAAIPQWDPDSAGQNLLCILFKAMYPRNYAYGGLDYHYSGLKKDACSFLDQVMDLMEMGFDGVKSIEAKPTARKLIDLPLDSPLYDDYYNYIQNNDLPMLWHVGDPEDNWMEEKCSDWVKQAGWCYSDGSFVTLEQLYAEVEHVLEKFPGLKAVFAHFCFLSADLERASRFLDRHPAVYFDITPGIEMIYNFSRRRSDWHDFFIEYQDRIIFGTDNGWGDDNSPSQKVINACKHVAFMRALYETDDEIDYGNGIPVRGLSLPQDVCRKIYRDNYLKVLGSKPPKPVDLKAAEAYGDKLYSAFRQENEHGALVRQAKECLDLLREISRKQG